MSNSDPVMQIDHGNWSEVVLNQPATRNAITGPLGIALAETINQLDARDSCELLLLRGAEGAFCSGLNLKEFNREPRPDWLKDWSSTWRNAHKSLFQCRKPIVAAVERFAINGGAALAFAADILLVGEDSFIQVGEVKQGMAAPYNLAWLHSKYPESAIAQLTLTGRRFMGSELHRMGIAYDAPPTDQVLKVAKQLCEELAAYPAGALGNIKGISRAYRAKTADEWFDLATNQAPNRRGEIPRVK